MTSQRTPRTVEEVLARDVMKALRDDGWELRRIDSAAAEGNAPEVGGVAPLATPGPASAATDLDVARLGRAMEAAADQLSAAFLFPPDAETIAAVYARLAAEEA